MKLLNIVLFNRAPFENLHLELSDDNVVMLSGINGAGKTTLITYIVDAFYELARKAYGNEFEGRVNKYYRVSSGIYALDQTKASIVYLRFMNDDGTYADYLDIYGNCSAEFYEEVINIPNKLKYGAVEKRLEKEGVVKYWSITNKNTISELFSNNLLTYFPAYRYEEPAYLNDPYSFSIEFDKRTRFTGYLPNPIEVASGLPQVANWIMDVVLDGEIYKGEALTIFAELNNVLNKILSEKTGCYTRFGIGQRYSGASRIAIMDSEDGKHQIYPSVFNMSSGELALLCLFGELIRQADTIARTSNTVNGIVLVDEVDKHLHLKLQKEILPKLFKLFPNVQFIVSSHSPFVGLGFEEGRLPYTVYDLDRGGIACHSVDVHLFRDVYDMLISENDKYIAKYELLCKKLKNDTRPIIITEGKTDWKHIKNAMKRLSITDLDIEFYEYEDALGDGCLLNLLRDYSRVNQPRKIVGIFDRDNFTSLSCKELSSQRYVSFHNNVFGFAIPAVNTKTNY